MNSKQSKNNHEVNIKKADKGSTTVIMNKQDKIAEGQIGPKEVQRKIAYWHPGIFYHKIKLFCYQ